MSQTYYDEYVRHMIAVELYGNDIVQQAEISLEELERYCEETLLEYGYVNTRKDQDNLITTINTAVDSFAKSLRISILSKVAELVEAESDWLYHMEDKYLGIKPKIPKKIIPIVTSLPFAKEMTIAYFLEFMTRRIESVYGGAINRVYVLGGDIKDSVDSIKQSIKSVKNGMKAELQTIMQAAAKNTDAVIFTATPEAKQKYVWCSVLDSNVCLVCGNMHGSIFDSVSKSPGIPVHERCRCFLIPVSEKTPIQMKPYSEWIKEQPADIQLKVLGRTRYQLFKGGMPITRFVNDGRVLRIDELDNKD